MFIAEKGTFKSKRWGLEVVGKNHKHRKQMEIEVVENPYVRVCSSAELLATPVRSHVLYTVAQWTFVLN
jgi:hypothetical protein